MKRGRKVSGGKYRKQRKSKLFEKNRQEKLVLLGETKRKTLNVRGGNKRTILLKENIANVLANKKIQKVEIKNVLETPQNRFWARQNRLVKGAIIETSIGKAKITNRPSKEGMVNAIIIE